MAATMVPADDLLVDPAPGSRITAAGRPTPEWREELRRVPSLRNAWSVAFVYVQIALVLGLAAYLDHPVAWVLAFLLMGRTFALLSILAHEAAHRMLFSNRRLNDGVGRWLLAYPAFTPLDLYRRGHMGHHREEFGPNEPDIPLYRGYPIARDSLRRKLTRDALGITGFKLLRGLARGLRTENRDVRRQAWGIVVAQIVIAAAFVAAGHPWLYPLLWFLPYLTVWRVLNRLRAIAEHGGMARSPDRRRTTHTVRQSPLARFVFVPYNTGWHLAHHVDPGIPWRKLPELHAELVTSGYVQPGLEYRSYPALWRALAAG
ncbi:MAG: fatty acid desaturase family protein [Acidimicrobiia bacterium]